MLEKESRKEKRWVLDEQKTILIDKTNRADVSFAKDAFQEDNGTENNGRKGS